MNSTATKFTFWLDKISFVEGARRDYFGRRDWESLALLGDKIKRVEGIANELQCPSCKNHLATYTSYDFVSDRCANCGGIWMDQAELEGVVSQIRPKPRAESPANHWPWMTRSKTKGNIHG